MWWTLIKMALDKNNSPAWQRVNNLMSIWKMSNGLTNSAKSTSTYNGAVTNDGMYGTYGG